MKTIETIKAEIQELRFGYWDDNEEDIIELATNDDFEKFMKFENWQLKLLDSIAMFKSDLVDRLYEDFISIWNRLDRLEE